LSAREIGVFFDNVVAGKKIRLSCCDRSLGGRRDHQRKEWSGDSHAPVYAMWSMLFEALRRIGARFGDRK